MISLTPFFAAALAIQPQPATDTRSDAETVVTDVAASAETAERTEDKDKLICRRTAIVGSKFKKRICATAEEWETLSQRGRDTTGELQKRGKGLSPNGG